LDKTDFLRSFFGSWIYDNGDTYVGDHKLARSVTNKLDRVNYENVVRNCSEITCDKYAV